MIDTAAIALILQKKEKNPDYVNPFPSYDALYGKPYVCPVAGGKTINYWNRCKHFQWNPDMLYTEPLPDKEEK